MYDLQYSIHDMNHEKWYTKKFVRNFHSFMQNEPNFLSFSPKNKDYVKNEPNFILDVSLLMLFCRGTNPNEPIFYSKIRGTKPNEANSNPISGA